MFKTLFTLASLSCAVAFSPVGFSGLSRFNLRSRTNVDMALKPGEKVIVIGVAADSGCGKSTFMRRLTKVFGGANVGPLGGGFGTPGGEFLRFFANDYRVSLHSFYRMGDQHPCL